MKCFTLPGDPSPDFLQGFPGPAPSWFLETHKFTSDYTCVGKEIETFTVASPWNHESVPICSRRIDVPEVIWGRTHRNISKFHMKITITNSNEVGSGIARKLLVVNCLTSGRPGGGRGDSTGGSRIFKVLKFFLRNFENFLRNSYFPQFLRIFYYIFRKF